MLDTLQDYIDELNRHPIIIYARIIITKEMSIAQRKALDTYLKQRLPQVMGVVVPMAQLTLFAYVIIIPRTRAEFIDLVTQGMSTVFGELFPTKVRFGRVQNKRLVANYIRKNKFQIDF